MYGALAGATPWGAWGEDTDKVVAPMKGVLCWEKQKNKVNK